MDDAGLDYPFMDASHFKYHANAAAEPVPAARGITTESKSAFIGLDAANSKSDEARDGFLRDLGVRGLACRCWLSATARRG